MIAYEDLGKLNAPFFEEFQKSFADTLKGGWYILGHNVMKFEEEFAQYCGAKHCVGVASGLDALILSIKALDLEPGTEVIVPSNTYIATILAILQTGLKPVLVEPDLTTYNIDPRLVGKFITSNTSAIMVVHLYGKVCDMEPIQALARTHGLKIIEDCAQAHGAKFKNTMAGTFGDCGAFSFYPTKNLGAIGDAGAILTDSPELAEKLRVLRNYGSKVKYFNEVVGYNSRLDEVQAGLLSIKLKHLDRINEHKRRLATLYHDGLSAHFIKPVVQKNFHDVFHIYNVRHPKRDELQKYLLENGIRTEIHYPKAPHKQKAMEGIIGDLHLPISEEIHATTLSLPISFCHSAEDISKVIDVMNRFPGL